MEKVFVVKRVAEKLWATESAIDAAMTQTAELMADVLKAPVDAGVSPTVMDATQIKVMEAMKALSEARTAVVAAHDAAYRAQVKVGIRTKMIGWEPGSMHDDVEPVRMGDLREVG